MSETKAPVVWHRDPDSKPAKSPLLSCLCIQYWRMTCTILINTDMSHVARSVMMEEITITVIKCTCERCGGTWTIQKGAKPPRKCRVQTCRSPYWNRPISRPKVSKIVKSVRAGTYKPGI